MSISSCVTALGNILYSPIQLSTYSLVCLRLKPNWFFNIFIISSLVEPLASLGTKHTHFLLSLFAL